MDKETRAQKSSMGSQIHTGGWWQRSVPLLLQPYVSSLFLMEDCHSSKSSLSQEKLQEAKTMDYFLFTQESLMT